MMNAFGLMMKPITIDKDSYIDNEYNMPTEDKIDIREELFGSSKKYFDYLPIHYQKQKVSQG